MIYYFSGTGNSQYAARVIADVCGYELCSLNDMIKHGEKLSDDSETPLIFVAPTHGWQIPPIVQNLIRNASFNGNKKAYFVMTCGSEVGNAEKYLRQLCTDIGLVFMGLFEIVMPENYIAMFPVPDEDEAGQIVSAAYEKALKAASIISRGEAFPHLEVSVIDKLKSGAISNFFHKHLVRDKAFFVKDTCISCFKCAALCPLNNIKMQDGKPVWGGDCMHCMACISACPVQAIEYGKKSAGKPRYYLTEIPPKS